MTAPMTREELLACPFCGAGTVELHETREADMAWVSCTSCGLEAPSETGTSVSQAISYWNRRGGVAKTSVCPADVDIHHFVQVYNFCFDGGGIYTPTDRDKSMIEDAINCYIDECEQAALDHGIAQTSLKSPLWDQIEEAYTRFPDEGDAEAKRAMGSCRYGFLEGYRAAQGSRVRALDAEAAEIMSTLRNPGPTVRPYQDFLNKTADFIERLSVPQPCVPVGRSDLEILMIRKCPANHMAPCSLPACNSHEGWCQLQTQPLVPAQTPALDAILEALKPFAALGMPRGRAVDTARVDIWERANHGDTRVLLTSPSQQGGSVTLSTADFRAAHDALAATQQSPRLAEQLYRRVITKDRIYYEPAERQQSPRLEREAVAQAVKDHTCAGYADDKVLGIYQAADAILALLSPDTTVVSSTGRGVQPCDPNDLRPIWEQGLALSSKMQGGK